MSETPTVANQEKDFVLEDNQLICLLTDEVKKISSKEENLQSVIRMLNEEYGFDLEDMERDYKIEFQDPDTGKTKRQKIELVVFEAGSAHEQDNIIRVCIVQDGKVKEKDAKKGLVATLENAMGALEKGEFGLWTNGADYDFLQRETDTFGNDTFTDLSIDAITETVESSELLSNSQKSLARQRLSFARDYVKDDFILRDILRPGRLVIVDLRDEFIEKDEALGLFVIMLNIFSGVKNYQEKHFNKFIVFDEAHKYMSNRDPTGNIVTAIREMRHKGVSIMIASQDPPSLPNEIIELSSIVLMHKFNSPQWLKHIQRSITQTSILSPVEMSSLVPGEGFLWATKATDKSVSNIPVKISTRPRVTKHGGGTIQATGDS